MEWHKLKTEQVIDLKKTLFSGQIFSFQQTDEKQFTGVVKDNLFTLEQREDGVYYKMYDSFDIDHENILFRFFTLDLDYNKILENWNNKVKTANLCVKNPFHKPLRFEESGLRLLRCDLKETIFAFICSTNNNIKRITGMVLTLCSLGDYITTVNGKKFFKFPEPERLCDKEQFFREKNFGYRAAYI